MDSTHVNKKVLNKVAFIGVGAMGLPMALNLLNHQYDVVTVSRSVEGRMRASASGLECLDNVADAIVGREVVITMLPYPEDVENIVFGKGGIKECAEAGSYFIDMSTSRPDLAVRIADTLSLKANIHALDCPVGGTEQHAKDGKLLVLAGGLESDMNMLRELFMCMARDVVYCGGPGSGQSVKLINNMLANSILQANVEALLLGDACGIDRSLLESVLNQTNAGNTQLKLAMQNKVLAGDISPGFAIRLAKKDLFLGLELANRAAVQVPVGAATWEALVRAINLGWSQADASALMFSGASVSRRPEGKEGDV